MNRNSTVTMLGRSARRTAIRSIIRMAVLAVILGTTLSMCTFAQKRECVTIHDRVPRLSLKQAVREVMDVDAGYSFAMQDYPCIVFARITHRARALSDLSRSTISLWSRAARGGYRLPFSQNEVEVAIGGRKYWFPIFKQYIGDILHKTREGEGVYLHLWALGVREDTPVFYIVNYGTINEWADRDEVLEDAVASVTSLIDPEESLAIVSEMETQWSGEEWWRQKHTRIAVSYVKGLAYLGMERMKEAQPFLREVREYITGNPNDDFTQTMLPALMRMSFTRDMRDQACLDALHIESPDDDVEQEYCDRCLRQILRATELGKDIANVEGAGSATAEARNDGSSLLTSYVVHGLKVQLRAEASTGVVTEKRVLIHSGNEDVLDWLESVAEDVLEDFAEAEEERAGEGGTDEHRKPTLVEIDRHDADSGEVIEVVFR